VLLQVPNKPRQCRKPKEVSSGCHPREAANIHDKVSIRTRRPNTETPFEPRHKIALSSPQKTGNALSGRPPISACVRDPVPGLPCGPVLPIVGPEDHPNRLWRWSAEFPSATTSTVWVPWGLALEFVISLSKHQISIANDLGDAGVAKPDDVLDAAAAAWTARRYAQGTADSLPGGDRSSDSTPSVIWY